MVNEIKFKPWVGNSYLSGINGNKIMVLGESHYCAKESDATPDMTNRIITDLFNPDSEHEGYKNTYTKFIRALSGDFSLSSAEAKKKWWNKILFYNYVQFPISEAREAPSKAEFADSSPAFFEILEKFRPDCILVWGKRLYNNLPRQGHQLPDLVLPDGTSIETWGYEISQGHTVRLLPITHPSSAFSPEYWNGVFREFIKRDI